MPTKTFLNLTKEKQNNILEAAKREFIKNSFYGASINKIIKDANISRGAFYMYFENKEDLFIYLMSGYKDKALESITKGIDKENSDVFDLSLGGFDYITSDNMDEECKQLFSVLLTSIDIKLINHCINLQNSNEKIDIIKNYTNIDLLNINSEEDLIDIADIIFSAVLSEIIFVLSGKYKASEARKKLERKFEFIKYGILK